MNSPLEQSVIDQLLTDARSQNKWQEREVSDEQLRRIVDILKMGPTSANCSPAQLRLRQIKRQPRSGCGPHLSSGNTDKTMSAPATAIIGYDMAFFDHLPKLFPHDDAKSWFTGNDQLVYETAFRNGTLQGAYLMLAARMIGLDVGGMSGFDNAGVDAEFFKDTTIRSNFLVNIGYGDPAGLYPRLPRFARLTKSLRFM